MNAANEHYLRTVMSGSQRGPRASVLRGGLAVIEPFYGAATWFRNRLFDAGIKPVRRLPRPVISIGNLTAGGTGKTPMVRWLAEQLRSEGKRVAVISRGYKAAAGQLGDEQIMLDRLLNGPGKLPVILRANPDRIAAAEAVLREHPETDIFLLDDGFQHRRVARDLDIVLLNASEPFGFDHILPRGMLRESASGLRRAGAVVVTHADAVDEAALHQIEARVRQHNPSVSIYRAAHAVTGLRSPATSSADAVDRSLNDLKARRFFTFCGIGNPQSLARSLKALGAGDVGRQWFADHHSYTADDLIALRAAASAAGAEVLVTTEKDWAKLAELPDAATGQPEIWRLDIEMRLSNGGDLRLSQQALNAMHDRAAI